MKKESFLSSSQGGQELGFALSFKHIPTLAGQMPEFKRWINQASLAQLEDFKRDVMGLLKEGAENKIKTAVPEGYVFTHQQRQKVSELFEHEKIEILVDHRIQTLRVLRNEQERRKKDRKYHLKAAQERAQKTPLPANVDEAKQLLVNAQTVAELERAMNLAKKARFVYWKSDPKNPKGDLFPSREGGYLEKKQLLIDIYKGKKKDLGGREEWNKRLAEKRQEETKERKAKEEGEMPGEFVVAELKNGVKIRFYVGYSKKGKEIIRVDEIISGKPDVTRGATYSLYAEHLPATLEEAIKELRVNDILDRIKQKKAA